MRLISFTAKNFKGIDESGATLNFAPITLLFGPNNAGKSTLMQAMRLAREVICNDNYNPTEMNLGGFANYVHKHDLKRTVYFGFTFAPEPDDYTKLSIEPYKVIEETKDKIKHFSVEVGIKWNKDLEKVEWCYYGVSINGEILTKIERDMDTSKIIMEPLMGPVDVFISEDDMQKLCNQGDICLQAHDVDWDEFVNQSFIHHDELLRSVPCELHAVLDWPYFSDITNGNCEFEKQVHDYYCDVIEIASSYIGFKDLFHSILETPEIPTKKDMKEEDVQNKIDALRKQNPEIDTKISKISDNKELVEMFVDVLLLKEEILAMERNNKYISSLVLTPGKILYKWFMENPFLYIGPLRTIPQRNFSTTSDTSNEWSGGLAAWNILLRADEQQIKRINSMLEGKRSLDIGYTIKQETWQCITPVHGDIRTDNPLTEKRVVLRNSKSDINIFPCDMGTGISQVIPIVVAADSATKDSTVMFEQPELHIHPKMQVELGDVLITAIHCKSEENNTPIFLIETHSEHLILRLLRRIRETNDGELPNGVSPITPDLLSVMYVQPNEENGLEIISLPVTSDGDFDRRWPSGFFTERAKELF